MKMRSSSNLKQRFAALLKKFMVNEEVVLEGVDQVRSLQMTKTFEDVRRLKSGKRNCEWRNCEWRKRKRKYNIKEYLLHMEEIKWGWRWCNNLKNCVLK